MNHRIVFRVMLWLRSPFLFRGLEAKQLGIDATQLRDEELRPVIPGDQVRGVLREAMCDLADVGAMKPEEIDELFGRASESEDRPETSNEPLRGRLIASDLVAESMLRDPAAHPPTAPQPLPDGVAETTRIEIDDALGSVRHGMLQVLELPAPPGAAVEFCGDIVIFLPEGEADRLTKLLNQALKQTAAIGAFKSPGFGEILVDHSKIERVGKARPLGLLKQAKVQANTPDFMTFRVTFDRPLLVDAERVADNAFRGSAIVPGAVFKGAIARRLELAGLDTANGALSLALAKLVISHAFPESADGQRALLPLPLSLVAAKDGAGSLHIGDALRITDGTGPTLVGRPALFEPDWKPGWSVGETFRSICRLGEAEDPPPLARTHTAIEGGVAKEQALFTSIARSVKRQVDGKWVPRSWLVDIDLGAIDDTAAADKARLLVTMLLEDGLDNIGKTGAHADFKLIEGAQPPVPAPIEGDPGRYAVVLATPALMLDPALVCRNDTRWKQEPFDAYAAYWKSVLPDCRLHSFFARQRLTGGYLSRRRRIYGSKVYFPFLLTEAGSIFEIETQDENGLERLWRFGLPPVALAQTTAPLTWRNCPLHARGRLWPLVRPSHDTRTEGAAR